MNEQIITHTADKHITPADKVKQERITQCAHLKDIRTKLAITVKQIASYIGCSEMTVIKFEKGNKMMWPPVMTQGYINALRLIMHERQNILQGL